MSTRILILASARSSYTTGRLLETAKKLGHKVNVVSPSRISLGFGGEAQLHAGAGLRRMPDVVLPRFSASLQNHGGSVLAQLEARGVRSFNSSSAMALVRDRVRCIQALEKAHVMVPRAVLLRRPESLPQVLASLSGPPVLLRRASGPPTSGALYCETQMGCLAALEALWSMGHEVLVTQIFPETQGEAIRCLLINGEIVACVRRSVRLSRTRYRFERRGKAKDIVPPKALAALMRKVQQACGLGLAGVDVFETNAGYRVLEVNAVPGIEQIELTSGRDIARLVVDALVRFAHSGSHDVAIAGPVVRPRTSSRSRAANR